MSDTDADGHKNLIALLAPAALALALCVIAIVFYSCEHAAERARAANTQREASIAKCINSETSAVDPTCTEMALGANYNDTIESYALKAQQELSLWGLLMFIITTAGVYYVVRTLRAAQEANRVATEVAKISTLAYKADSEPFLILKPTDPHCIKLEVGEPIPGGIACEIQNTGKGAAEITGIFRAWQIVNKFDKPEPVGNLTKLGKTDGFGGWTRKTFQLPIGPNGRCSAINSLSDEHEHTGERWHDGDWVYFLGYIEYKETGGEAVFKSGFCYVWRPEIPALGLHVAFNENPQEYWYHKRDKSREIATRLRQLRWKR
jgi:hypothetical protein